MYNFPVAPMMVVTINIDVYSDF